MKLDVDILAQHPPLGAVAGEPVDRGDELDGMNERFH
jgi:hypothetical protein